MKDPTSRVTQNSLEAPDPSSSFFTVADFPCNADDRMNGYIVSSSSPFGVECCKRNMLLDTKLLFSSWVLKVFGKSVVVKSCSSIKDLPHKPTSLLGCLHCAYVLPLNVETM